MKHHLNLLLSALVLALAGFAPTTAIAALKPEAQARVDARLKEIQALAADPVVINTVAAQNAGIAPEQSGMTEEMWSHFNSRHVLVHALSSNPAAEALRAKCAAWAHKAFVSDQRGLKVAFLRKPANWSHAGNPRHDEPMAGHAWQGAITIEPSTGLYELQVAVPVLKDGVPIGSLVVGLDIEKL